MYLKRIFSTIVTLLLIAVSVNAQDMTLTLQGTPQMKIDGDSNLRSWGADVTEMDATLVLQNVEEMTLESITPESFKSLQITIPVESIESDSRGLTKNIHKYLKEKDYPQISFTLNSITDIVRENGTALITAEGVINAAGKDNPVTMTVTATMNPDGSINFSGEQELLMTSFDIDPPTAILGTVRADDEFSVIYDVNFNGGNAL
ncbi:MAG: YceI family protein [Balneolaceae bacterium]|nr:YceI family protein [Balneolaceae bacterium]